MFTSHNDSLLIKKDLNLPSFSKEFSDGYRPQGEIVSQESIDGAIPKVLIDNESEIVRVLSGSVVASEPYGLIGDKSSPRINISTLHDLILHVVLGPSNEPRMRLMEMGVERIKLDISLIHEIIGVRLHRNFFKYLGIVDRGLCPRFQDTGTAAHLM